MIGVLRGDTRTCYPNQGALIILWSIRPLPNSKIGKSTNNTHATNELPLLSICKSIAWKEWRSGVHLELVSSTFFSNINLHLGCHESRTSCVRPI
jgi:hypothetical protein